MQLTEGHLISHVQAGSIAGDLGLQPGDRMLLLDGRPVPDVFDFRLRQLSDRLLLTIQSAGGEITEYDIEKDEDEDLGLEFDNPLLADCSGCENHCVFCFIDQLPPGLRPSLYFKDDDLRLSFLTGNYVSLTNITDEALDRLISYRLSPVNISVHTTDARLRLKMMRHRLAGSIMERLNRIAGAGIAINAQIVLCPGLNDGPELTRTIADLAGLGPAVRSIAVVPVGLTRYRQENRLYPLRPLSAGDAAAVLAEIRRWQQKMLAERQTGLVYAADEIYLKAGVDLPDAAEYDDFPQLENGIGMAALLRHDLAAGLKAEERLPAGPVQEAWPTGSTAAGQAASRPTAAVMVTGTAAAPLLQPFVAGLAARSGLDLRLAAITNRFFGETVTVAGLLTGQDLISQLPAILGQLPANGCGTRLILPDCLLKDGETVFLDNCTLQQLADSLKIPVHVCPADAAGLLGLLDWLTGIPVSRSKHPGRSAKK